MDVRRHTLGGPVRASGQDRPGRARGRSRMASRSNGVHRPVRRTRRWPVGLVGLALVLGSVACTADDPPAEDDTAPVVQLGAPGEDGTTLSPDEAEAVEEPTYTDADVAFVQMMLPHHQQALEMTALVEDRAADPDLVQLAERIEVSQQDEIALLEEWLSERGEMVSDMHGEHGEHSGHGDQGGHQGMPGMLTPAQLEQLARS